MPPPRAASPVFSFPKEIIARAGDADVSVEIELCHGDIADTPSKVILLGQMRGLDPTSAAAELDTAMEGNLFRLLTLRGSARGPGSLEIIPTGRFPIMADLIAFLGLGNNQDFSEGALTGACRSALRSLLASTFDEFSTTLMGGRRPGDKTIDVKRSLLPMMRGFIEALREDPQRDRFRRIIVVERDAEVLETMHRELAGFVRSDPVFAGVRTVLRGTHSPFRPSPQKARGMDDPRVQSNALILSLTGKPASDGGAIAEFVLTAILKPAFDPAGKRKSAAAVRTGSRDLDSAALNRIYELARVNTVRGVSNFDELGALSAEVGKLLPSGIGDPLDEYPPDSQKEPRLEIVHDAGSAPIPWETLRLKDGRFVGVQGGICRRFVSEGVRSLWPPEPGPRLRILLVIDPKGELQNATEEGEKLREALEEACDVETLTGREATCENLIKRLNDRPLDVLHFAGHGGFSRTDVRLSGLCLADGIFTARDALQLSRVPAVLVFNSCESARIEKANQEPGRLEKGSFKRLDPAVAPKDDKSREVIVNRDQAQGAISLAEAFLISGVHHYIGTFWPVNDKAATLFGISLHATLAGGGAVGAAVTEARKKLKEARMPDWANYIHYGDPDATLHLNPFGAT